MKFKIQKCEDTGKLAFYRLVKDSTWELLLHETEFEEAAATLNPLRPFAGLTFRERMCEAMKSFVIAHSAPPTRLYPGRDLARELLLAGRNQLGFDYGEICRDALLVAMPEKHVENNCPQIFGMTVKWGDPGEFRLE